MNDDRRALLGPLGVDPDSTPLLRHVRALSTAVAHGLAGPESRGAALGLTGPGIGAFFSPGTGSARPAALADLSPLFEELDTIGGLELGRHQLEPSVICVESVPVATGGAAQVRDGAVWLDGRGGLRGAARFETSGGPVVVEIGPEGLFAFDLSPRLEALTLERWEPFPDSLPALPPLDFVSDGPVRARILALASSPSRVERAAAVGTAARLHAPGRELAAAILDGRAKDPTDIAGEWARSLSSSERTALERVALERASRLREELADLQEELPIDDYLVLARERDALASVQTVLWRADGGGHLAAELRCVDLLAITKSGYFPEAELPEADAWLLAVATEDPDAWWALWV